MKIPSRRLVIGVIVAASLIGGAAATAVALPGNGPSSAPVPVAALSATEVITADASGWTLSNSVPAAPASEQTTIVAAPTENGLDVRLDGSEIEQYWFWSSGVRVQADGLMPGEQARVSVLFASGTVKTWAPVVADSKGNLDTTVRYLDVDPENTRPEAGVAQIRVTADSGAEGSALLNIVADEGERLQVTADPGTISQDDFLDRPVHIAVTGFVPLEKVFFNLGLPDTSMQAVGETEGLHADETGTFAYDLQVNSVNALAGTWLLSFQSASDLQGSGSFRVTADVPRAQDKVVSVASPTIAMSEFADQPGMRFSVEGFLPFDSYETILTTPRGVDMPIGIARSNGEGRAENAILAPASAPSGTYTIRVRSTTTGDFGTASFEATSGDVDQEPILEIASTIPAASLADPAVGLRLEGSNFDAGVGLRISLRDANWNRLPLTVGADLWTTVDSDGSFSVQLVTLEPIAGGSYTVWITGGGGVQAYDLRRSVIVTDSTPRDGTSPAPAPSESAPTLGQGRSAPDSPSTPSNATPAPTIPPANVQPTPAPTDAQDDQPLDGPFDNGAIPIPSPTNF